MVRGMRRRGQSFNSPGRFEELERRLVLNGSKPVFNTVDVLDSTIDVATEIGVTISDPEADQVSFVAVPVPFNSNPEFNVKDNDHVQGAVTAQVILIEYLDFQ